MMWVGEDCAHPVKEVGASHGVSSEWDLLPLFVSPADRPVDPVGRRNTGRRLSAALKHVLAVGLKPFNL